MNPLRPENLTISLSGSLTYIPAIPSTTTLQLPSLSASRSFLLEASMEPSQRMIAEYTGMMSALAVVSECGEGNSSTGDARIYSTGSWD